MKEIFVIKDFANLKQFAQEKNSFYQKECEVVINNKKEKKTVIYSPELQPYQFYVLFEKVGSGSFGTVFSAYPIDNNGNVLSEKKYKRAVKQINYIEDRKLENKNEKEKAILNFSRETAQETALLKTSLPNALYLNPIAESTNVKTNDHSAYIFSDFMENNIKEFNTVDKRSHRINSLNEEGSSQSRFINNVNTEKHPNALNKDIHSINAEKRPKPLTFAQKMQLVLEATVALGNIHKANIIHEDIKPDNISVNVAKISEKYVFYSMRDIPSGKENDKNGIYLIKKRRSSKVQTPVLYCQIGSGIETSAALATLEPEDINKLKNCLDSSFHKVMNIDPTNLDSYQTLRFTNQEIKTIKKALREKNTPEAKALIDKLVVERRPHVLLTEDELGKNFFNELRKKGGKNSSPAAQQALLSVLAKKGLISNKVKIDSTHYDFGVSTQDPEGIEVLKENKQKGTLNYMPPEKFNFESGEKSDVWSLLPTVLELIGVPEDVVMKYRKKEWNDRLSTEENLENPEFYKARYSTSGIKEFIKLEPAYKPIQDLLLDFLERMQEVNYDDRASSEEVMKFFALLNNVCQTFEYEKETKNIKNVSEITDFAVYQFQMKLLSKGIWSSMGEKAEKINECIINIEENSTYVDQADNEFYDYVNWLTNGIEDYLKNNNLNEKKIPDQLLALLKERDLVGTQYDPIEFRDIYFKEFEAIVILDRFFNRWEAIKNDISRVIEYNQWSTQRVPIEILRAIGKEKEKNITFDEINIKNLGFSDTERYLKALLTYNAKLLIQQHGLSDDQVPADVLKNMHVHDEKMTFWQMVENNTFSFSEVDYLLTQIKAMIRQKPELNKSDIKQLIEQNALFSDQVPKEILDKIGFAGQQKTFGEIGLDPVLDQLNFSQVNDLLVQVKMISEKQKVALLDKVIRKISAEQERLKGDHATLMFFPNTVCRDKFNALDQLKILIKNPTVKTVNDLKNSLEEWKKENTKLFSTSTGFFSGKVKSKDFLEHLLDDFDKFEDCNDNDNDKDEDFISDENFESCGSRSYRS